MTRKLSSASVDGQFSLFAQVHAPDILRKAVQAVHIAPKSGRLGLQQRKMFSSLIKNAILQNTLEPDRTIFSITIGALSRDIALNSNNTQYVKDTVNSLIGTVVNWDYLAHDRAKVWKASGLLAGAELEQSVLKYSFSEQIKGELLNPEIYALIDMRIAREFKRSHSLALWENTVRYEAIGITARIPLQKFRDLILGQEKSAHAYPEYKLFKSKILNPCIVEVNQLSNHTLELIEHKLGRCVQALQFRVKRKQEMEGVRGSCIEPDDALITQATELGLSAADARRLCTLHGNGRFNAAITYTVARLGRTNAQPLGNRAAYLRTVLERGYMLGGERKDGQPPVERPARDSFRTQEQVRERYLLHRSGDAWTYFNELGERDRNLLVENYNTTVNASQLKVSRRSKVSKLAQTGFMRWLVLHTWGEPTSEDLLEFVLAKGE